MAALITFPRLSPSGCRTDSSKSTSSSAEEEEQPGTNPAEEGASCLALAGKDEDLRFSAETRKAETPSPATSADAAELVRGRKHMSRAERRSLKRRGEKADTSGGPAAKKVAEKPLPRGKRSKVRRIRDRYGEQSDEEREYAMKLLGAQRLKLREDQDKKERNLTTAKVQEHKVTPKAVPVPDRNIAEEIENQEEKEESRNKLDVINQLTGRPLPEVTLLSAVPVCAPPEALRNYLYKGKILPGGGKKGQAVKTALQTFVLLSSENNVQRELIKQISVDELSACLVANPIVQIQGMEKVIKEQQKAKRIEKKLKNTGKK